MKVSLHIGPNLLGVRTGADLDTKDLPPQEAEKLRELLDAAQIGAAGEGTSAVMADQRKITIRVETPDRLLEATFPEGQTPPGLEPVLAYLDQYVKVIPSV